MSQRAVVQLGRIRRTPPDVSAMTKAFIFFGTIPSALYLSLAALPALLGPASLLAPFTFGTAVGTVGFFRPFRFKQGDPDERMFTASILRGTLVSAPVFLLLTPLTPFMTAVVAAFGSYHAFTLMRAVSRFGYLINLPRPLASIYPVAVLLFLYFLITLGMCLLVLRELSNAAAVGAASTARTKMTPEHVAAKRREMWAAFHDRALRWTVSVMEAVGAGGLLAKASAAEFVSGWASSHRPPDSVSSMRTVKDATLSRRAWGGGDGDGALEQLVERVVQAREGAVKTKTSVGEKMNSDGSEDSKARRWGFGAFGKGVSAGATGGGVGQSAPLGGDGSQAVDNGSVVVDGARDATMLTRYSVAALLSSVPQAGVWLPGLIEHARSFDTSAGGEGGSGVATPTTLVPPARATDDVVRRDAWGDARRLKSASYTLRKASAKGTDEAAAAAAVLRESRVFFPQRLPMVVVGVGVASWATYALAHRAGGFMQYVRERAIDGAALCGRLARRVSKKDVNTDAARVLRSVSVTVPLRAGSAEAAKAQVASTAGDASLKSRSTPETAAGGRRVESAVEPSSRSGQAVVIGAAGDSTPAVTLIYHLAGRLRDHPYLSGAGDKHAGVVQETGDAMSSADTAAPLQSVSDVASTTAAADDATVIAGSVAVGGREGVAVVRPTAVWRLGRNTSIGAAADASRVAGAAVVPRFEHMSGDELAILCRRPFAHVDVGLDMDAQVVYVLNSNVIHALRVGVEESADAAAEELVVTPAGDSDVGYVEDTHSALTETLQVQKASFAKEAKLPIEEEAMLRSLPMEVAQRTAQAIAGAPYARHEIDPTSANEAALTAALLWQRVSLPPNSVGAPFRSERDSAQHVVPVDDHVHRIEPLKGHLVAAGPTSANLYLTVDMPDEGLALQRVELARLSMLPFDLWRDRLATGFPYGLRHLQRDVSSFGVVAAAAAHAPRRAPAVGLLRHIAVHSGTGCIGVGGSWAVDALYIITPSGRRRALEVPLAVAEWKLKRRIADEIAAGSVPSRSSRGVGAVGRASQRGEKGNTVDDGDVGDDDADGAADADEYGDRSRTNATAKRLGVKLRKPRAARTEIFLPAVSPPSITLMGAGQKPRVVKAAIQLPSQLAPVAVDRSDPLVESVDVVEPFLCGIGFITPSTPPLSAFDPSTLASSSDTSSKASESVSAAATSPTCAPTSLPSATTSDDADGGGDLNAPPSADSGALVAVTCEHRAAASFAATGGCAPIEVEEEIASKLAAPTPTPTSTVCVWSYGMRSLSTQSVDVRAAELVATWEELGTHRPTAVGSGGSVVVCASSDGVIRVVHPQSGAVGKVSVDGAEVLRRALCVGAGADTVETERAELAQRALAAGLIPIPTTVSVNRGGTTAAVTYVFAPTFSAGVQLGTTVDTAEEFASASFVVVLAVDVARSAAAVAATARSMRGATASSIPSDGLSAPGPHIGEGGVVVGVVVASVLVAPTPAEGRTPAGIRSAKVSDDGTVVGCLYRASDPSGERERLEAVASRPLESLTPWPHSAGRSKGRTGSAAAEESDGADDAGGEDGEDGARLSTSTLTTDSFDPSKMSVGGNLRAEGSEAGGLEARAARLPSSQLGTVRRVVSTWGAAGVDVDAVSAVPADHELALAAWRGHLGAQARRATQHALREGMVAQIFELTRRSPGAAV